MDIRGDRMNSLIGNFIGFDGRLNRQPFWISGIIIAVVSVIISLVILPLLGLSMMPNLNIGADTTAADVAAVMTEAAGKSRWISLVMFAIFVYPSAAICIKRRHDRNNNGMDVWVYLGLTVIYLLVQALGIGMTTVDVGGVSFPAPSTPLMLFGILVGILGIYLLVVLGFLKGTAGANQYGPDPLQG